MKNETTLAITSLIIGILFITIALPLIKRKIPPNHFYGLRIPATFADTRVWYEANAKAGKDLAFLGILVIILSGLIYVIKMPFWLTLTLWSFFILCGLVVLVIKNWHFANKLLKIYKQT